jgi:hypothetical protein
MPKDETPAIIIAVAFIGLVAFLFWVTMDQMDNADDFLKVWAAVGPIVGVVTGLIPTYFFRSAAKSAELRADNHAVERGKMEGALRAKGLDPEELLQGSAQVQDVPPPA